MDEFETLEPCNFDNVPDDYVSEYDRWLDSWADEDDGDALASAGMGTDEDYGYYGEDY
jgi:hypothetical protein